MLQCSVGYLVIISTVEINQELDSYTAPMCSKLIDCLKLFEYRYYFTVQFFQFFYDDLLV